MKKIYTHARMLSPSKFFGTAISHGLISDGCICHASAISRSVIGVRSRIGQGTVIKNSIIMGNEYYQTIDDIAELPQNKLLGIGNNCYIENSIIDKNVRIGNNVTLVGSEELEDAETESYCIREGIIIVKKDAFIKENTHVGLNKRSLN